MNTETEQLQHGTQAFILNRVELQVQLPYEIFPGCVIEKATLEMEIKIQGCLDRFVGGTGISPRCWYEDEITEIPTDNGISTTFNPSTQNNFRYYLVSTLDNGTTNTNLQLASSISILPIQSGSLCFYKNQSTRYNLGLLQNYFNDRCTLPISIFTEDSLNDVRNLYHKYMAVTCGVIGITEFPEVQRALQMYGNLNSLPNRADFHVIGLFAIIEMLITHNPKLEDRGDSITHQMQSKIPLLSRRFDIKLNVADYFGAESSDKKTWKALYEYRSAIAHGGVPDFKSKELKILKDQAHALKFLKEAVRSLIRHALNEPHLYRDLRNC